jgi:hypothetical protein
MITAKQAKAAGYCITSRAATLATRIDREDWREHMADQHPQGMDWVKCLGKDAADQYRRVYSKDNITVPAGWVKLLPNSGQGPTDFSRHCKVANNDKQI